MDYFEGKFSCLHSTQIIIYMYSGKVCVCVGGGLCHNDVSWGASYLWQLLYTFELRGNGGVVTPSFKSVFSVHLSVFKAYMYTLHDQTSHMTVCGSCLSKVGLSDLHWSVYNQRFGRGEREGQIPFNRSWNFGSATWPVNLVQHIPDTCWWYSVWELLQY